MTTKDLYDNLAKNYNEAVKADKKLLALWRKAERGVATYADADKYAVMIGDKMANAFDKAIVDAGLAEEVVSADVSNALLRNLTKGIDNTVGGFTRRVQAAVNKRGGVGLSVVDYKRNQSRVDGLVEYVTGRQYSEVQEKMKQNIVNYSQSVTTGTMRANISAQEAIGVHAIVERIYDGVGLHDGKDPCEWCMARAGTWTYDEANRNGVFERHDGCGCTITYEIEGDRTQLQTDWKSNTWEYIS